MRDAKPGVEVLLPVLTPQGWIMINLGYIPKPRDMSLPSMPVLPTGDVQVTGYLYRPDKPRVVLSDEPGGASFPLLMQRLDWETIANALGASPITWQVRIDLITRWHYKHNGGLRLAVLKNIRAMRFSGSLWLRP